MESIADTIANSITGTVDGVRGRVGSAVGQVRGAGADSVDSASDSIDSAVGGVRGRVGSAVHGVGGTRHDTSAGLGVVPASGGRVGVHGCGCVVSGRSVTHGHRLGRGRVRGPARGRNHWGGVVGGRGSSHVVAVGLDNNGLNLLGDNGACGPTGFGGTVAVDGGVFAALLAPAPAQETGQSRGSKGSEDNTGNGATRDFIVLGREGGRDGGLGGSNKGSGGAGGRAAGRGGRHKGLGALAGAVLVGVTVGILQSGQSATSNETLDVDRVLIEDRKFAINVLKKNFFGSGKSDELLLRKIIAMIRNLYTS